MGKIWMPGGGGGGASSDDCTLLRAAVPAGMKAVTADSDDEAMEGTLNPDTTLADSQALSGQTFLKWNPQTKLFEKHTGGMANKGAWTGSVAMNGSITIPAGFHNGSGNVKGPVITNRGNYGGTGNSRGNDTSGKRMWVKVPGGYYNENAQVFLNWADIRSMAGLTPDKIKKNVSIMGIIGAHDGFVPGPMDVYNRGSWGSGYGTASITPTHSYGSIEYKNSNIVSYGGANNGRFKAFDVTISKQGNPINLQPYKTVNVVYSTNTMNLGGEWEVKIRLSGNSEIYTEGKESATERTISLNISNVGITDKIQIYGVSEHWDTIYIYRVYFT